MCHGPRYIDLARATATDNLTDNNIVPGTFRSGTGTSNSAQSARVIVLLASPKLL